MNLIFIELLCWARHSAKCLKYITSFNAHNGPMRYIFSSPWFILGEKLAREIRLHTTGKSSRDGVRDASPGLVWEGGSPLFLGIGYPSTSRPSLSLCLALGKGSIPSPSPKPHTLLTLLPGETGNRPQR